MDDKRIKEVLDEKPTPPIKEAIVGINKEKYENLLADPEILREQCRSLIEKYEKAKLKEEKKTELTEKDKEEILKVVARIQATETFCIFYEDGTTELVDLTKESDPEKKGILFNGINAKIISGIKKNKNYYALFTSDKRYKEKIAESEKVEEKNEAISAAIIGLAVLIGATGLMLFDKTKDNDNSNNQNIEQNTEINNNNENTEIQDTPDMTGKDPIFYGENAPETSQKAYVLKLNNWLSQIGNESWTKITLTEDQMKEYGLANPECTFGLTAEEAYALSLRFGHFTNDEYIALTGGANIDTVNTIDTANNAMYSIRTYYICSDECDLNIEQLINFNEKELAKVNEVEAMLAEWKKLVKDETQETEAFEKMKEIKKWFNEFANTMDPELDSAKSYLLRTILPACSILSEIYQYQETESIDVYDTKNDVYKTKEIKTALFDELMMRSLIEGFDEFDEIKFLKVNNISSSRYTLRLPEKPRSFADDYCSVEIERLNQANEHINSLRIENTMSEAAFAGSIVINPNEKIGDQVVSQMDNVDTRFDQLTEGTYIISELLEMINSSLKQQGSYPQNINYFNTAKRSELQIEYNSKHGVTQGEKGDKVTTEKEVGKTTNSSDLTAPNTIITDNNGEETTPSQAMEEAKKEEEKVTGQLDASTPEASQKADEQAQINAAARAAMLQNVYTETYQFFYAGDVNGYDASWAVSSDSEVANRHNTAKADAENRKNVEAEAARLNQQQNNQSQAQPVPTPSENNVVEEQQTTTEQSQENNTETNETKTEEVVTPVEPVQPVQPVETPAPEENVIPEDVIIDPEFQDAIITTTASNETVSDEYYDLEDLGLTEDEFKAIIKVKTV